MAVQHPANGGRVIFDPKRDMPPAQTPGIIIGTAAAVIGVRVGLTYIVNLTSMYPTGRTGLFSANASNKLPVAIINEDSRVWVQWYPRTGIVFKAHVI